jgi:hypothetical protein
VTESISLDELPQSDDPTRRDRWGRYLVVPPQGGQPTGYTRATTIAKVLDSGGGLAAWKAAMTVSGMLMRPGLRAKWEALMAQQDGDPWYGSPEGKAQCKALVEECAAVGGSRDRAQVGLALHAITALIDAGKSPKHLSAETAADVGAYQTGLVANGINLVPGAIELTVVLDTYQVAGTFDRLARVQGRELPIISDLKTGGSLDYSFQSFAVQLAIYSRGEAIYEQGPAKNGSDDIRHPMPAVDQEYGLIFWLNAGTAKLEIYEVDLNAGWEAFKHSMWTRGWRNERVSHQFVPGPTDLEKQLEASLAAHPRPPGSQLPPPASDKDVSLLHQWLQQRIDAIGANAQARIALGRAWPPGVPPIKASTTQTPDQIAAIEKLLDDIERRYEIPFGPPNPLQEQAVAKVINLFPDSTVESTNPKGSA